MKDYILYERNIFVPVDGYRPVVIDVCDSMHVHEEEGAEGHWIDEWTIIYYVVLECILWQTTSQTQSGISHELARELVSESETNDNYYGYDDRVTSRAIRTNTM